jgi:hypothetical protein
MKDINKILAKTHFKCKKKKKWKNPHFCKNMSLWCCWKSPCHTFTSPSWSLKEKSSLPIFCKCGWALVFSNRTSFPNSQICGRFSWLGWGHTSVTSSAVELKKWEMAIDLRIGCRFENLIKDLNLRIECRFENMKKGHRSEVQMSVSCLSLTYILCIWQYWSGFFLLLNIMLSNL